MPRVAVTAAATPLFSGKHPEDTYTVLIRNVDAANVVAVVASDDQTFADGYQVAAATQLPPIQVSGAETIYGICNTGLTAAVDVVAFLAIRGR